MKIKREILYLSLYNHLRKKVGVNGIITRKEFFCDLGKHFIVPKPSRPIVIKEMESMGLMKRENKENLRVLSCEIDIENNVGDLYKKAKLFTIF